MAVISRNYQRRYYLQEEVNRQTISLMIKGGKISANILKSALKYLVKQLDATHTTVKKQVEASKAEPRRGEQTLEDLNKHGAKLTNIQITDQNIGDFKRVARKYSIDFALKKDKTVSPPVYYVFFKAKDLDTMTTAFKEYTRDVTRKKTRPSLLERLSKAIETVRETLTPQKERRRHQERDR